MCNGDAQELDDLCIIPIASMLPNSTLAAANLSRDKRRARAWTGGDEGMLGVGLDEIGCCYVWELREQQVILVGGTENGITARRGNSG